MTETRQEGINFSQILRGKVNQFANYGILIGFVAIFIANLFVVFVEYSEFSLDALTKVHQQNIALWILDIMPILFALWGQYVGYSLAFEASALVVDETHQLRNRAQTLEGQVIHSASYDQLTELPNRSLLGDRTEQAITSAQRTGEQVAILALDLDDFKEINNTLGHFSGDLLLKQFASRLSKNVRDIDTVARLSGDEFAVLLTSPVSKEQVMQMAEKLCLAVQTPFRLGGLNVDMLMSVGIAMYPEHGDDINSLLQKADIAMFIAKQQSGMSIEMYSPDQDKHSPQRLTIMGELRDAIENNGLFLEYQPKVDMNLHTIVAVESLVRWEHPRHGRIPPEEFVSLAERTGLIRQLTFWVLEEAVRQCREWDRHGFSIDVAVNVSTRDLLDTKLQEKVMAILQQYELAPTRLIIEITESAFMEDQEYALQIVSHLAKLGIRISIDDFGTGYSSMAYLRRLPVKELKIDKSFVMGMQNNDNDIAIVRATIGLAQNLGLTVIAEGVADDGAWRRLVRMGCDVAQGYYISPPVDSNGILKLMGSSEWALR